MRRVSLCGHAAAITPVGPRSLVARASCLHGEEATYSPASAFPVPWAGRLPRLSVSRPARRSLTLRPACSRSRPRRPFASKASAVSLPPPPLRLLPAGATFAGWELHPLKTHAFSRRTKGTDFRDISHHEVRQLEKALNNRPRACLGFRNPDEVFFEKNPPAGCD